MICQMNYRIPESADDSIADTSVVFDALYDGVQAP